MEQQQSIELKWITAPSDGIGQAILLTIRNGKRYKTPIQYLLNVPEGFSRLVLEHRCRPGPGLRALFLTDLSQEAQGGLGGLLLRLRQDGHAALRVVGPAGLHDTVEGLSYFVRWMHPALELTAITSANQGCVYDDECLEVRPIWPNSLLWQVPPWLSLAAGGADQAAGQALWDSLGKETAGKNRLSAATGLVSKLLNRKQRGAVTGAVSLVAISTREKRGDVPSGAPREPENEGTDDQGHQPGGTPSKAFGADGDMASDSEAWDSGSCSTASTSSGAAVVTNEGGGRGGSGSWRGRGRGRRRERRVNGGVMTTGTRAISRRGCSGAGAGSSSPERMEQTSGSSTTSSSTTSSSTTSSSSKVESEEDHRGATRARISERRRCGGRNNTAAATTAVATAAGPGGCSGAAKTSEDLFSKLDRLFMAGGRERRDFGARTVVHRQGTAAVRASGVPRPGEAATPDGSDSMALRALVMEELRSTVSEHRTTSQKCPTTNQRASAKVTVKQPAASCRGTAKPMAAPAATAPPHSTRRPTDKPPLAYLLHLKPTRQAVLVVCASSRSRVDTLAAHPVTALLRRTPPGLLLAVVNIAATEATCGWQYRRHVQATLPGPQVWPDLRPAPTSTAPLAGLGYVSSARVMMRLNAVSPAIFPLPYQVRTWRLAAARRTVGKADAPDAVDRELANAIAAATAAVAVLPPPQLMVAADVASQLKGEDGLVSEPSGDESGHQEEAKEAGLAHGGGDGSDSGDAAVAVAGGRAAAVAVAAAFIGAEESGNTKARSSVIRDCKLARTAPDRTAAAREGSVWKAEGRIASLLDTLTCTVVQRDVGGSGRGRGSTAVGAGVGRCRVPAVTSGDGSSESSDSENSRLDEGSEDTPAPSDELGLEEVVEVVEVVEMAREKKKQRQPEVVVQWWDDRSAQGQGQGQGEMAAPAPASAPEPLVLEAGVVSEPQQHRQRMTSVGEVQRALLQERRGSGMVEMLMAFRSAFPHLARSSETERRLDAALRAPKPSHDASMTVRQRDPMDQHPQQQQHEGDESRAPIMPAAQQTVLPQDCHFPFVGCDNGNGGWHTVGPVPQRALSAEEELAAAAAAYGVPERTGTIMRPSYSYQVSYGTDQHEHRGLFLPQSGSSGQPPQWKMVNGGGYGDSQQPTWSGMNGSRAHAEGDSWQLHPLPQHPYSKEPNQLNHPITYQGNGWRQQQQQPPQPMASGVALAAYGMSQNVVLSPTGMTSRPAGPWLNAPRFAPGPNMTGGGGGGGGATAVPYDGGGAPTAAAIAASINATAPPVTSKVVTTPTANSIANQLIAARLRSSLKSSAAGGVLCRAAAATVAVKGVEVVETVHTDKMVGSGIRADASEAVKVSCEEVDGVGGTNNGQSMGDGEVGNNWAVARRVRRRLMTSDAVYATAAPATITSDITAAAGAVTDVAAAVPVAEIRPDASEIHPETDAAVAVAAVAAAVAKIDLSNRGIAMQLRAALRDRSSGGSSGRGAELQPLAVGSSRDTTMEDPIGLATEEAAAEGAAAAEDQLKDVPYWRSELSAAAATSLEAYLSELEGSGSGSGSGIRSGLSTSRKMAVAASGAVAVATAGVGDPAAGGAKASRQNTAAIPLQPAKMDATATDDVPPPACLLPVAAAAATTTTTEMAVVTPSNAANVAATAATEPATTATAAPVGEVSVLFLGTGCAEPSKYRGASAVLVMGLGPTRGSLLIDAGEGTYGSMVRWLGPRGAMEKVASLELIWISHKHPDHLLGLPTLLEARGRGRRQMAPLLVVGPKEAGQWLDKLAPLHPSWRYTFLHCARFSGSTPAQQPPPQPTSHQQTSQHLPPPLIQQQQQQQQQQRRHILRPAGPYWQSCPCCPPYTMTSSMPYGDINNGNLTAGATAADWFLSDLPPQLQPPLLPANAQTAVAGPGLGPDKQRGPSAAARRWWHQRQQQQQRQQQRQQPSQPPPPPPKQQQGQQQWPGAAAPYGVSGPHDGAEKEREKEKEKAPCQALGLVRWHSVAVHHCRDAWGLVLEHRDGWKLVYSGDTRPCPALISAGRGATLLIHEATFEPCLESQARSKRHCTSAEAAAVADAMGAYRTVLTHFSQRYPHIPSGLNPTALPLRRRPLPAFDGMLLPLAALRELPHIVPPLALALTENTPAAV
ncbi:hypothetical protein Vafri_9612 [Volvox africanus]|uniref:ribonuclease Z n=1 Tax=Volvox africanus TaxID=51714 RepID=A0A8J4B9C2_9CHLO|nr:hypothetical protein Vafri_9612 [Volvox africanus]